jgi:hypothetical protein
MRFFFLGPRIFGIRPGISLGASDFRKATGALPPRDTKQYDRLFRLCDRGSGRASHDRRLN